MKKKLENESGNSTLIENDSNHFMTTTKVKTHTLIAAASTINCLHDQGLDLSTLAEGLANQVEQINAGNIFSLEAMLITQTKTLNIVFNQMMKRMAAAQFIEQFQIYADIGLKAQEQTRKTIATLLEIKNPKKPTFIKQQNNAINQQINNSSVPHKKKKSAN